MVSRDAFPAVSAMFWLMGRKRLLLAVSVWIKWWLILRQGDIAVIIGKSGKAEVTACEISEQAGTVSTKILGRLGARLERVVLGALNYAG